MSQLRNYRLVDLSAEALTQRRQLLDQAGFIAYATPISILLLVAGYRQVVSRTIPTFDTKQKKAKGSSPVVSFLRRIPWQLGNTHVPEFGPLHVQVVGLGYLSWLIYLIFSNTGEDYMHLTKSFGHVAISQLPMQYLLSIKSAHSPITKATGLTHERINAYHRLFGRILHLLLAIHAIMYLGFFVYIGVLSKRIKNWDVRYGVIAFWSFNFLGLLAIPPIRRKAYHRLFYRSHVFLSMFVPLILWLHVSYTRKYVLQAVIIWSLNGIMRSRNTTFVTASLEAVSKNIIKVNMPVQISFLKDWAPGMHIYLRQGGLGPKTPFTISKVSKGDQAGIRNAELVIRNLGGPMTGYLGLNASSRRKIPLLLEGPYGEAQIYMPELLEPRNNVHKVLVVAGGVGATFAVPIYSALVQARGNKPAVKFLWVARRREDIKWAESTLDEAGIDGCVSIYVTKEALGVGSRFEASSAGGVTLTYGKRPDLKTEIDSFMGSGDITKHVAVLVCGPSDLSQSLRSTVGWHVMTYGTRVSWYEEQFGFGGS